MEFIFHILNITTIYLSASLKQTLVGVSGAAKTLRKTKETNLLPTHGRDSIWTYGFLSLPLILLPLYMYVASGHPHLYLGKVQ